MASKQMTLWMIYSKIGSFLLVVHLLKVWKYKLAINTPVIIDPACLENDFLQLIENMPGVIVYYCNKRAY